MNVELEQQVRNRAYEIWEREGYPDGRALDHWAQAAKEIDQQLCALVMKVEEPVKAKAGAASKKPASVAAKSPRRSSRAATLN